MGCVIMLISSPMKCTKCNHFIEVKITEKFITLKCRCKCIIHNPDGDMKVVPYEIYCKNHKGGKP